MSGWVNRWPVDHEGAVREMERMVRERSLLGPWRLRPYRWLATAAVEFKPQDCWVGAFWKVTATPSMAAGGWEGVDLWVCLVPMLPIHVWWYRRERS